MRCAMSVRRQVSLLFVVFLGILQKRTTAEVGLPLIQISHDAANDDYAEVQEEVHLEDFFWTGSGDGPPDYLKKVHTGISKGKDVIVKTETVVATVYVDGNNEIDIPICLDCYADDGGGGINTWGMGSMPPLNYSATDRRYWLLTVMSGFYSQKDNPELEERLARLYRLAFTRQQTRHLGINGAQQIAGISVSTGRGRRQRVESTREGSTTTTTTTTATTENVPSLDVEILDMTSDKTHFIKKLNEEGFLNPKINSELESSSEESELELSTLTIEGTSTESSPVSEALDFSAYVTLIPWELIQQNAKSEKVKSADIQTVPHSKAGLKPLHPLLQDDRVRVKIHNITQITEDDLQRGNIAGNYDDEANLKIDERPIANQTELIYTVFVNQRPVMAVAAANDMKFVSETEAATIVGNEVYMKSEPYLREPQATPLAPATHSGSVGFLESIQNNPALVIVSSVALLLLLLLFVALLLMGRTRAKQKEAAINRATSQNELLSEGQSMRPSSRGTMLDTDRATTRSREVGVQNLSFESESAREARIHFPEPPLQSHARRDSITSSDNTSDSSVYCPINPPNVDVQRMLDEKAATMFDRQKRRHHQYDRAEGHEDTIYSTVVSEKKSDKTRTKQKRRYLSENRVGSLETSPTPRSVAAVSSGDEMNSPDAMRRSYEAFNPQNNYHRNKLLHQKTVFTDKDEDNLETTQAINKEIIRALQPSEKSSDTGSVGSFLSMASVRAFPKSALPEPLNRVLDPVFVTYYDNIDDPKPNMQQRTTSAKSHGSLTPSAKLQRRVQSSDAMTIATIENFPSPKAPPLKTNRAASHSDNPDPGVVGPIVWERHKKRLSGELNMDDMSYVRTSTGLSTIHDPSAIRNHFEGLLEGAIQMYSSQDDLPMPLPTHNFNNKRRATKRENRGSSAGLPSYTSLRAYSTMERPATAQPEKTAKLNHSTQPPSPSTSAWGGSVHGSHSPLVRPMSAGPFHRPEPIFEVHSSNREHNSAAPLIEAIQTELRKFKPMQR